LNPDFSGGSPEKNRKNDRLKETHLFSIFSVTSSSSASSASSAARLLKSVNLRARGPGDRRPFVVLGLEERREIRRRTRNGIGARAYGIRVGKQVIPLKPLDEGE
jgi:hypothetical protein